MADVYKQSFKQNYTNTIELSIFILYADLHALSESGYQQGAF